MSNIKLAIVGATGAVGREFLRILAEQQFPAENLFLVASSKSAGKAIKYFEKNRKETRPWIFINE